MFSKYIFLRNFFHKLFSVKKIPWRDKMNLWAGSAATSILGIALSAFWVVAIMTQKEQKLSCKEVAKFKFAYRFWQLIRDDRQLGWSLCCCLTAQHMLGIVEIRSHFVTMPIRNQQPLRIAQHICKVYESWEVNRRPSKSSTVCISFLQPEELAERDEQSVKLYGCMNFSFMSFSRNSSLVSAHRHR